MTGGAFFYARKNKILKLLKFILVSGTNLQILYVLDRPVGQFEKETPFEEETRP